MPSRVRNPRADAGRLATSYPLERTTLGNGLRVVVSPDRSSTIVGVAVYYDVGFRSEPEGRTGFAHLFEHMMFQGSQTVGKMQHAHLVQGAGGSMNGSTHPDYTNYFEVLPSNALELALFLEADRMRSLALTEENLANQVAVVKNEIRVNVLNRPYGGFPWILLPPVAFDSFPNSHNGYGDFTELEAATLDDAADFFTTFYCPANAVLAVVGDCDPTATMELVERHFADIRPRPAPPVRHFAEPALEGERRAEHVDRLATAPAVAIGWRAADPGRDPDAYLADLLLCETLAEGDASRLHHRLVTTDRSALTVQAYLGTFGDPYDQRDPQLLTITAMHPAEVATRTVLAAVDEELGRIAAEGLDHGELVRVQARLAAQLLRRADNVLARTQSIALFELLHGGAEASNALTGRVAGIGAADVQAAAVRLVEGGRAVLELTAGNASNGSRS